MNQQSTQRLLKQPLRELFKSTAVVEQVLCVKRGMNTIPNNFLKQADLNDHS